MFDPRGCIDNIDYLGDALTSKESANGEAGPIFVFVCSDQRVSLPDLESIHLAAGGA